MMLKKLQKHLSLCVTFVLLSSVRIYRGALWILGEYCSTKEDIQSVMTEVRRSLGEVCAFILLD